MSCGKSTGKIFTKPKNKDAYTQSACEISIEAQLVPATNRKLTKDVVHVEIFSPNSKLFCTINFAMFFYFSLLSF